MSSDKAMWRSISSKQNEWTWTNKYHDLHQQLASATEDEMISFQDTKAENLLELCGPFARQSRAHKQINNNWQCERQLFCSSNEQRAVVAGAAQTYSIIYVWSFDYTWRCLLNSSWEMSFYRMPLEFDRTDWRWIVTITRISKISPFFDSLIIDYFYNSLHSTDDWFADCTMHMRQLEYIELCFIVVRLNCLISIHWQFNSLPSDYYH